MDWITGISLLTLGLYSVLILFYTFGLLRITKSRTGGNHPKEKVSVIVPFRNELENLPSLVSGLSDQDYPGPLYEVLLVNDHSTDGSALEARSLTGDAPGFKVLDLPEGRQGKKAAIEWGISQAQHAWILQTDADCTVDREFIRNHMAFRDASSAQLVAGLVSTRSQGRGFLEAFERLDVLGLTGTAAGSFAWGRPLMCSGANLLYSKQLYEETRHFDPGISVASGDDMFLMIGARRLGRKLGFNTDRRCLVLTSPVRRFREWVVQRIRWGGKAGFYGMAGIQMTALLVVLSAASVWSCFIGMAGWPEYRWWCAGGILFKLVSDLAMLTVISGVTGQRSALKWYLPVWLLYQPFLLIAAAGSLFARFPWKGRRTFRA